MRQYKPARQKCCECDAPATYAVGQFNRERRVHEIHRYCDEHKPVSQAKENAA